MNDQHCGAEPIDPVLQVHERLVEVYGEPRWRVHLDPISELVSTILSQNTNDVNRDRAFGRLRGRFASWEAVRDADESEVKEAIAVAGLANHKGPAIQRALQYITDRTSSEAQRGDLSLVACSLCRQPGEQSRQQRAARHAEQFVDRFDLLEIGKLARTDDDGRRLEEPVLHR